MRKPKKKRSVNNKIGLPPGSLIYTGEHTGVKPFFEHISYADHIHKVTSKSKVNKIELGLENEKEWFNYVGLHDIANVEFIGQIFNIDPLTLEDILSTKQRPKYEGSLAHAFITMKVFHLREADVVEKENLSIYLKPSAVLTFQENKEDFFNRLRERLSQNGSKIQNASSDYLFIRLIDTVVDNYFLILDHYETKGDDLEELLFENYENIDLREIHDIRKELKEFRKSVNALKEAVYQLIKDKNPLIAQENEKFVLDVHDHLLHINEAVDGTIELYNGLFSAYDSHANKKLNQIMKMLTILSSIFIPITFLAGIYGMNFDNMPELKSTYGYYVLLSVMIVSTILMLFYFKKKRWL